MAQSRTLGEQEAEQHQTELKASVRPSVSALAPASSEPETREQRLGEQRNGAYKEHVTVRQVDPQEEAARKRQLMILGLEVALAFTLVLARQVWTWAREERTRARIDRVLRRRIPAT
jgi:hypothetical protein